MAARKRTRTPDVVRKKLQTSMFINRLTDHALGKNKMSASQVRAAGVLLRKTLPDLARVEWQDTRLMGDLSARR